MGFLLLLGMTGCQSTVPQFSRPALISLSPDGKHLVSFDTRHQRFYITTLDFRLEASFTHHDFDSVWGFCITADNQIVVPNNRYAKVTFSAEEKKEFGIAELLFFDFSGNLVHRLGWQGETGPLVYPNEIIEYEKDLFYVSDLRKSSVVMITRDGTVKGTFGAYGDAPGQIYYPNDLAKTPDGNILVADCYNSRLQLFDRQGQFLRIVAESGTGDGQVRFPEYLSVAPDGGFFCTEFYTMRVSEFDNQYRFVRNWTTRHEKATDGISELYGIQVLDNPRQILVVDSRNGVILRYGGSGNLLESIPGYKTQ